MSKVPTCSFCDKTKLQVKKLVAGPDGIYICENCVGLCADIIEEDSRMEIEKSEMSDLDPSLPKVLTDEVVINQCILICDQDLNRAEEKLNAALSNLNPAHVLEIKQLILNHSGFAFMIYYRKLMPEPVAS
jgi:hypothetical protein